MTLAGNRNRKSLLKHSYWKVKINQLTDYLQYLNKFYHQDIENLLFLIERIFKSDKYCKPNPIPVRPSENQNCLQMVKPPL